LPSASAGLSWIIATSQPMMPAVIIGAPWLTWMGMTCSLPAFVIDRSAPIAPIEERRKLSALSGANRPEKLVAMKADRSPIRAPCSISALTKLTGSPQAWPKTMRSPRRR